MAAISEKILWPIVAIFIFGVFAGFYIDDRRRLMEEGESLNKQASSNEEHDGKAADHKQASNDHAGKAAEKKPSSATTKQTASANSTGATYMDINEYLAQSTSERNAELEANVTHHQGFSGSIEEYLSSNKAKATKNMQAKKNSESSKSQQAAGATSMSIDEYLAKYGNGTQTNLNTTSGKPFNKKEHVGFHGSHEAYAKKYN